MPLLRRPPRARQEAVRFSGVETCLNRLHGCVVQVLPVEVRALFRPPFADIDDTIAKVVGNSLPAVPWLPPALSLRRSLSLSLSLRTHQPWMLVEQIYFDVHCQSRSFIASLLCLPLCLGMVYCTPFFRLSDAQK